MPDFYIFPTESLLLGELLGEYERRDTYFLDLVRRRLLPIMPSLIESKEFYNLGKIKDFSRKSLLDLIFAELKHSLSLSKADEVFGINAAYGPFEHAILEVVEYCDAFDIHDEKAEQYRAFLRRSGPEAKDAIQQLIGEVARTNGYGDLLSLGEAFGRAIADCESGSNFLLAYALNVHSYDDEFRFAVADRVDQALIVSLVESDLVKSSSVGRGLLASEIQKMDQVYILGPTSIDRARSHIDRLLGVLWCAFGEVLGQVRDLDYFARGNDVDKAASRVFRVTSNSSRDDIRYALQDAERRLVESHPEDGQAEKIIADLARAEPLKL